MPRILLFVSIIFCSLFYANTADAAPRNHEQMHSELLDFKIKYLAQEMDLDAENLAKFEPLYRQMEDERHNLFKGIGRQVRALKDKDKPSDTELLALTDDMAALKQREGSIELSYYRKFKQFLTPTQLYKLKRAEEKFTRKVMKMRGKHGKHGKHNKKGK